MSPNLATILESFFAPVELTEFRKPAIKDKFGFSVKFTPWSVLFRLFWGVLVLFLVHLSLLFLNCSYALVFELLG